MADDDRPAKPKHRGRPPTASNAPRWVGAWLVSALVTHGLVAYVAASAHSFGRVFGCCEFSSVLLISGSFTKIAHSIWQRKAGRRAVVPIDILVLITLVCATAGAVVMIGFFVVSAFAGSWHISG